MKWVIILSLDFIVLAIVLMIQIGGGVVDKDGTSVIKGDSFDFSKWSDTAPKNVLDLLFIHHSCGGLLFADPGPEKGEACIYESHPSGGSLRRLLGHKHYLVHEASYGSEIGENTDIMDWPAKFGGKMDKILKCSGQNTLFTDERVNRVVMFKSCFPNNLFCKPGTGKELTVEKAKEAMNRLLGFFERHPRTLFVYLTAPPLAPKVPAERIYKKLVYVVKGMKDPATLLKESGPLARAFNNWVKSPGGWLKDYKRKNVVVFDLYDVLTGLGASNYSKYATRDGFDSHPSKQGNEIVAALFVPFLNRAVKRSGIE